MVEASCSFRGSDHRSEQLEITRDKMLSKEEWEQMVKFFSWYSFIISYRFIGISIYRNCVLTNMASPDIKMRKILCLILRKMRSRAERSKKLPIELPLLWKFMILVSLISNWLQLSRNIIIDCNTNS